MNHMPLYEYECDVCHHRFERIQKYADPPVDVCPACGGAVHKLLSSPAIQFKGSGWYITDYARAGKGEAASAKGGSDGSGESAAAKGDGAGESKTETKSESKTESKTDTKTKTDPKPSSSTSA